MFRIEAPYPLSKTTIVLPSPLPGNSRASQATVQRLRAVDGTLYTYVKKKRGRKSHSWDFRTSRDKATEMKEFMRLYCGSVVRTVDHNGDVLIGYLSTNPIELTGAGRAGGWPGGEASEFSLTLDERV